MKYIITIISLTLAIKSYSQTSVTLKDPKSDLTSIVTLLKTKTKEIYKLKISLNNGSDSFRQQLTPIELFSFEDEQGGTIKEKVERNFDFKDINGDNKTDILIKNYISGQAIQGLKIADKSAVFLSTKNDYLSYSKQFSKIIGGNEFEINNSDKTIRIYLQSSSASSYGYELYKIEKNILTFIEGKFICVAGVGTNDLDKRQVIFTKLVNGKKTETKKILDSLELEKLETEDRLKAYEK